MFNDITKPPPPLPKVETWEVASGIDILLPLTRRGNGPGIIILTPDFDDSLAIKEGVPAPMLKWAEEGYVVAQIQAKALSAGSNDIVTQALKALSPCEKLESKDKQVLIGQ